MKSKNIGVSQKEWYQPNAMTVLWWALAWSAWLGAQWPAHAGTVVVGWGGNSSGLISVPPGLTDVSAIAQGAQTSLALRSNGTVVAWGCSCAQTNVPAGLSNVIAIAAGDWHELALRSDGTVVAWGYNNYGQASVPTGLSNVVAIAATYAHSLALKKDGTVVLWGLGPGGGNSVPVGLANVVAIGAAGDSCLALRKDGSVVSWGPTVAGWVPLPSDLTNVVAISGAFLALKNDGTVAAWGDDHAGQTEVPPGLTNVVAIAGNGNHNLAIRSDGTVVGWGDNSSNQTNVPPGITNVLAVSVGGTSSLALVASQGGFPIFTTQPQGQNLYSGMSLTLTANAEGVPAPVGWWEFNGTNLPDVVGFSVTLTNLQTNNSGNYQALASNFLGTARSQVANVSVINSGPIVPLPPQNQTVMAGASAVLTLPLPASGSLPLGYQWQFNYQDLPGATSSSLTFSSVQSSNQGNYRVVITNAYGALATTNAYLSVVGLGDALDGSGLTWSSGGDALWGPQSVVTYQNTWGYVAQSGVIANNQISTLQTTVSGPGTLSFYWQVSSQPILDYLSFDIDGVEQARISGTTGGWSKRTFYLGAGSHSLLWVYAKGPSGSGGQDAGWLDQVTYTFGSTPPGISGLSGSQTCMPGSNVTFSVSAYGTPPLTYQWQFNGNDLKNATSASLSLTNVQLADRGAYRVVVTGPYGTAISSNAILNVFLYVGPPQPQDALDRWYLRSTAQLTRVRYVGNLFVGLGTNGVLMTSPDGTTWTARSSGTTADLNGVAFGTIPTPAPHDLFVAVGSGGTILTSSDGANWNSISATTQDLNDVAWNGTRFVATATANSSTQRNVLWSADGILWSGATFPSNPDTGFPFFTSALGVTDGYFITAGGSSFAYYIWRSSNGFTWQNVGFSDAVVAGVAAGNARALIVGWEGWPRVSTNSGASWFASASSVITTNAYQPPYYSDPMVGSDAAFGNGSFVVTRSFLQNGLLTTTDALTWTKRDLFAGASIESIAYGNGTFVVVCSGGAYPAGIYQSERTSSPIMGLSLQTSPKSVLLNISGEVGRSYRLQTSSDLQSWTDYRTFTNSAPTIQFLEPVSGGSTQLFYKVVSP